MQRLTLTGGVYTFASEWIGHVLYGVPAYAGIGIARHIIGYNVYFPHPVGGKGGMSSRDHWFFKSEDIRKLDPLLYKDKPRFTLITSFLSKDIKVWAKVVPSEPSCHGCSYNNTPCMGKTPPCSATYRHKGDHVIFVTSIARW